MKKKLIQKLTKEQLRKVSNATSTKDFSKSNLTDLYKHVNGLSYKQIVKALN